MFLTGRADLTATAPVRSSDIRYHDGVQGYLRAPSPNSGGRSRQTLRVVAPGMPAAIIATERARPTIFVMRCAASSSSRRCSVLRLCSPAALCSIALSFSAVCC